MIFAAQPVRVIVADDHRDAADTLCRLLELEGHQVRAVYDGPEVLQAVREFCPDIVILDIDMPTISGYDVARALRASSPTTVLIALTGWKQNTDKILAQCAGFHHHLGKPCQPNMIVALLSRLSAERMTS